MDQEGAGGDKPDSQDDQVPLLHRQVGAVEADAVDRDLHLARRRAAARVHGDGRDIVELRLGFRQGQVVNGDPPPLGDELVARQMNGVGAVDHVEFRGHRQGGFVDPVLEAGRQPVLDQQLQVFSGAVIGQAQGYVVVVREIEPVAVIGRIDLQAIAAIGIGKAAVQRARPGHWPPRVGGQDGKAAVLLVGVEIRNVQPGMWGQVERLTGQGVFAEHRGEGQGDQQEDGRFDLQVGIAEPAASRLWRRP